MKLKTLEEIKFSSHIEEDLRQEAIKWIERLKITAIQKRGKKHSETIDWIKHFFNIKNGRT